jgi:hypothetical protein
VNRTGFGGEHSRIAEYSLGKIVSKCTRRSIGHIQQIALADQVEGEAEVAKGERRAHVGSLKEFGVVAYLENNDHVRMAIGR